nr:FAD:protein FMN transferase [Butyricicoccus sp. OF13-6]
MDYKQVQQNGSDVSIPADVQVDLGGIAKGYTSDRIMQVFADNGVTSGIVSLGGNVQVLGCKPDGSKWRVAVQDPNDEGENFAVVEIADEAVITSGGYQRYFEEDGATYHHIIDPRTGYPADSGVISSTIISHDGTLADGLSTSLFIMGVDDALDYWRAHSDEFDAILMDENGAVYVTDGIADRCSLLEDRKMQVVR